MGLVSYFLLPMAVYTVLFTPSTVDQLTDYLKQHWPVIREQLLNGTYEPKPVRRVEIPKPDGSGMRKLGIPTVAS
jgi:retron-type reverse transcriptase